jgi:predicted aldo/keto reductase-like oxidoreductase
MSAPPTDDLFVRYMKAFEDSITHTGDCLACQGETPCAEGVPIHERFARLQDAYTARQKQQR